MVIPLPPPGRVRLARVDLAELDGADPVFGVADVDGRTVRWVVLRRSNCRVVAFVDRCPHWSVSLASGGAPHHDDDAIYCSRHGARFRLDDGVCDAGPCEGGRLKPLDVEVDTTGTTLYLVRDRLVPDRS